LLDKSANPYVKVYPLQGFAVNNKYAYAVCYRQRSGRNNLIIDTEIFLGLGFAEQYFLAMLKTTGSRNVAKEAV
jgi:hypothetical protein